MSFGSCLSLMPHRSRFRLGDFAFTWDPAKAEANFEKHHIGFTEAATSFLDPHGLDGFDERTGREKLIAYSEQERLLLTVYTEVEGSVIRIISARRATRSERAKYESSERLDEEPDDGYTWRRNPYAAALDRSGIRVLSSALSPGARTFDDWANRRDRARRRA